MPDDLAAKLRALNNIPQELKDIPQWIVHKDKVPYDAKSNNLASVNNPDSWSDYNTAKDIYSKGTYSGIGFVFISDDPYCFIDLDDCSKLKDGSPNPNYQIDLDRQLKIFNTFESYAEISPSGKGLHIICKGSMQQGRRKAFIEVYSSARYATMTGNVHKNIPIKDCQEQLTTLWEQMGDSKPTHNIIDDEPERYTDEEIIKQASKAANSDLFNSLYEGKWNQNYSSQSEADYAFINILQFYTKNTSQIKRLFRSSKLGSRDKAKREDYVNGMINKSFDRDLPKIDIEGYTKVIELKKFQDKQQAAIPQSQITLKKPPGLVGELAEFIYQAAPRPVLEIAVAAAIGLMAGICGRAYNISGTGLNQYVLIIAKTGSGKEGAASGIDKLMNSIKFTSPTSINFRGPGIINSGQALAKYIGNISQCFVSVLGEFGIRLENMSSQNANAAEKMLKLMLLDLYNKSGEGQTLQSNIYSSKEDTIGVIDAPAFSILGESTPDRFYTVLNETMINEGLLPRFMIVEYNGKRPEFNENHQYIFPDQLLTGQLSSLTSHVEMLSYAKPKRKVFQVAQSDEALKITRAFNKYADNKINATENDTIAELWNRAHMKVLKLAALIAVGCDMNYPTIRPDHVEWAINMVQHDINALSAKFDAGEIGSLTDDTKQVKDMIKTIKEYYTKSWGDIKAYCPSAKDLYDDKIIPYEFFSQRTSRLVSFRKDKQNGGATSALKKCLQILVDSGKLEERTKDQNIIIKFGTGRRVFVASKRFISEME